MTDTTHPSDLPRSGVVRAKTYLSVLIIEPRLNGLVTITIILQADMVAFGLPSRLVGSFLPKGIVRFFEDLKHACATVEILTEESNELPAGW
ncbi:hypothetical protein AB6A40_004462 [Gnathostoma spinigerum]|uniref:START domain-containing protein n=1 Tax=Gnathostoma spinigerum TaxID=75299 RepID=A0ABD6ECK3_9BILA